MPVNVSELPPTFVSEPPAPEIPCEIVVSNPLVSMVPPEVPRAIARVPARLKVAPNCSVPPFNVTPPEALPRLLSAATDKTPPVIDVPPL